MFSSLLLGLWPSGLGNYKSYPKPAGSSGQSHGRVTLLPTKCDVGLIKILMIKLWKFTTTLQECSALLPTLLAVTVLFSTAILKVTTLNSQGLSILIQWKISKTSFLGQLQSLTMELFLVSIQPIICLSNPLDLILVSLWMRWSCSCIMRFNVVVLTDMQKHISLPAIQGLVQPLLCNTGGQWIHNHPRHALSLEIGEWNYGRQSQGSIIWRVKQRCNERLSLFWKTLSRGK